MLCQYKFQYRFDLLFAFVAIHLQWIFWLCRPCAIYTVLGLLLENRTLGSRIIHYYKSMYIFPKLAQRPLSYYAAQMLGNTRFLQSLYLSSRSSLSKGTLLQQAMPFWAHRSHRNWTIFSFAVTGHQKFPSLLNHYRLRTSHQETVFQLPIYSTDKPYSFLQDPSPMYS